MPSGSLKVLIIMPSYWFGNGGQWNVDGGAWQDGGVTIGGLSVGNHTVNFSVAVWPLNSELPPPPSQIVVIRNGETAVTAGSYCFPAPEFLIETGPHGLKETKTLSALDTAIVSPLFFAASSMDAAFSGFQGTRSFPYAPGEAYSAAKAMGVLFGESYQIMLEGGQIASDFLSLDEIEAIATYVAPYLTPLGADLPGGVPVRIGYILEERLFASWRIQRGKGFSLKGAVDAGFLDGIPAELVNAGWNIIGSVPGPPKIVAGFSVAFNGQPILESNPAAGGGGVGEVNGMPINGDDISSRGSLLWSHPIVGYPALSGANVSFPTPIAGVISLHTVNDDDTINAALGFVYDWWALVYATGPNPADPTTLYQPISFNPAWSQTPDSFPDAASFPFEGSMGNPIAQYDEYNAFFHFASLSSGIPVDYWVLGNPGGGFPPVYYTGSPDWVWTLFYAHDFLETLVPYWHMTWAGTNSQTNIMPLVFIFWIGLDISEIPQQFCHGPFPKPGAVNIEAPQSPSTSFPLSCQEALNTVNRMAPDRNSRITQTTNGTVSPFNISLTNPESPSSYKVFNLQ